MKANQRIIRLVAFLMAAIITLFSLSSCSLVFEIYNELLSQSKDDEGKQPNDNNEDPTDNDHNHGAGNEVPEFYPGSGVGDTTNLPSVRQTLLSTVSIISTFSTVSGAGSGVIYSIDKEKGDAYIVTNQHVVYEADYGLATSINLFLYGMELSSYAIPATYVGGSTNFDIAVLKVENSEVLKSSYARAATFASSDKVRVFDTVYVVGNAGGYGISATQGIVSVESESIYILGADDSEINLRVIRTDSAINLGNSGGGLYDSEGRLIGIVCARGMGSDKENIGYAIPSDLTKNLVESIIYHCNGSTSTQIKRARMGITITAYVSGLVVDENGDLFEAQLVEVIEVSNGSLASGKVLVGDIINSITVDGVAKKVTQIYHVTEHMLNARVGSTVTLNITRGEENLDITFKITADHLSSVK